jgi:DNA replication protein DnaC
LPDKQRIIGKAPGGARDTLRKAVLGYVRWPVFFTGEAGSGKTCLALAMLDFYNGMYYTTARWCERVRDAETGRLQSRNGYSITRPEVWQDWERADIVVLDELGKRGIVSDHHYDTVQRCIDSREGQPAIFISNLSLKRLRAGYDDSMASRLGGGTVRTFKGDKRLDVQLA